jgi:NitT/TauT family transport system substrate-binding protein
MVVCVTAALAAAGCGGTDRAASGTATAEPAASTGGPITLAVGVDPVVTPIFVADAQGLFEKEGLDVQVRQFANAGEAADALVAGAVDVAGVPDYNLLARAPRADLSALGIFAHDHGDYVKVVAAKGISDPQQMKKIGIVPGTYSEYAAAKLLEHAGVDPSTAKFVPTGPPELPALLQKGDVDGYVIWPPWTTRGEEMGGKILMTTGDYGLGTVLTVATTDGWLQAHADQARALMRAIAAGARATEDDPAAAGSAAADAAKLPAPLTESAVGELDFTVRGFTADDRRAFDAIGGYLVQRGILKQKPSLDDLLVDGYVTGS